MAKYLFKKHNAELVNHTFQMLLVAYLILLLIEQIWSGIVSTYLNLNYLLIVVIVFGILDVFSETKKPRKQDPKKSDYVFITVLAILGLVIIKFKTGDLGWLSWVISIIAGILIFLISLLILEDDDEEKNHRPPKEITLITPKKVFIFVAILVVISIGLFSFTSVSVIESFRIVFGSVYVLFLPGLIISFIFFQKTREFDSNEKDNKESSSIDVIERIALSFALSIAIVPLTVFYVNLIGIKINVLNSFLTILGIIIISVGILFYKNKKKHI